MDKGIASALAFLLTLLGFTALIIIMNTCVWIGFKILLYLIFYIILFAPAAWFWYKLFAKD